MYQPHHVAFEGRGCVFYNKIASGHFMTVRFFLVWRGGQTRIGCGEPFEAVQLCDFIAHHMNDVFDFIRHDCAFGCVLGFAFF